ncbi:MAG: hypothetical protein AAFZ18_03040 [Myxococcota bacterium]
MKRVLTALFFLSAASCFPELKLRDCREFPLGSTEGCRPACDEFCEFVVPLCPGIVEQGTVDACKSICREKALPGGDPATALEEDSLACRLNEAEAGRCSSAGFDPSPACPNTACKNYCDSMVDVCPGEWPDRTACLSSCTSGEIPAMSTPTNPNSLECRVAQLNLAANSVGSVREAACEAAGLTGGTVCGSVCDIFCRIQTTNCTGDLSAYDSQAECLATCNLFPPGVLQTDFSMGPPEGNNAACRVWHATAAGQSDTDPPIHCPHTRPYNRMVCGNNFGDPPPVDWACSHYCELTTSNCPGLYPSAANCMSVCAGFPELQGLGPNDEPPIFPSTSTVCPTSPNAPGGG